MQNEENDQNCTVESSHNRNPSGKNQHKDCRESAMFAKRLPFQLSVRSASADDVRVRELLVRYHHENITNAKIISGLLQKEGFVLRSEAIILSEVHMTTHRKVADPSERTILR
jgi:hypothetical protein